MVASSWQGLCDRGQLGLYSAVRQTNCIPCHSTFHVCVKQHIFWHIFHEGYSTLCLRMQNNDPLVECHQSSKTHFQLPVFCEDRVMHPNMLQFVASLTAQKSYSHLVIWLQRDILLESDKSFYRRSIWGSDCLWCGNNFHDETNLADNFHRVKLRKRVYNSF